MSFRNAYGIYHVIEQLLKASDVPLTCVDLFDSPDVRKFADDANRVSDYLGHMYRRKLLNRYPAPRDGSSMARFAYTWKDPKVGAPVQRVPQPRLVVTPIAPARALRSNVQVEVQEEPDGLHIDLENFTLIIRRK